MDAATCRSELERLRIIRDCDLPDLLRDAWAFATTGGEEVAQIHEDLRVVHARIERLEQMLRTVGAVADA